MNTVPIYRIIICQRQTNRGAKAAFVDIVRDICYGQKIFFGGWKVSKLLFPFLAPEYDAIAT